MKAPAEPPRPPRLMPGCLYSIQDLEANLKTSRNTIKEWLKDPEGPRPVPMGTECIHFLSDDLFRYFAVLTKRS